MSEKEIKVGDWVRQTQFPFEGKIAKIDAVMSNGIYVINRNCLCTDAHIEKINPKTAFLTELKELLKKYDAEITCKDNDWALHIDIGLLDKVERISFEFEYPGYDCGDVGYLSIDAENIMDYDK